MLRKLLKNIIRAVEVCIVRLKVPMKMQRLNIKVKFTDSGLVGFDVDLTL